MNQINKSNDTLSTREISNDILIVEDSRIIQNIIAKTLSLTEYNTVRAANGKEALTLIKEKKGIFRAILLDFLMPIMNGIELIQIIRKLDGARANTTVIGITGNHNEHSSQELEQLGFNAVILKPLDCNEVVNMLERLSDPAADRWLGVLSYKGEVIL